MISMPRQKIFDIVGGNKLLFFNLRGFYSLKVSLEILKDNLNLFFGTNKKLLIIGVEPVTSVDVSIFHELFDYGIDITVLDINKEHCDWVRQAFNVKTINMDATEFNDYNSYDCVLWRHGPEHVTKEEFEIINDKVKTNFIIECPQGDTTELDGLSKEVKENNKGMGHISSWELSDFTEKKFIVLKSNERAYMNDLPHICGFRLVNICVNP